MHTPEGDQGDKRNGESTTDYEGMLEEARTAADVAVGQVTERDGETVIATSVDRKTGEAVYEPATAETIDRYLGGLQKRLETSSGSSTGDEEAEKPKRGDIITRDGKKMLVRGYTTDAMITSEATPASIANFVANERIRLTGQTGRLNHERSDAEAAARWSERQAAIESGAYKTMGEDDRKRLGL